MDIVVALLALVVALLVFLVVGLLRSHADILRTLHEMGAYLDGRPTPFDVRAPGAAPGPERGVVAANIVEVPDSVDGTEPSGDTVSIPLANGRTDTLLTFLTTGCVTCSEFWQAFAAGESLEGMRAIAVTRGADGESPGAVAALAADLDIEVVMSSDAWSRFGVPGAPYFVHLDPEGRLVGEGVASSWDQLSQLVGRATVDRRGRNRRMSRRAVLGAAAPPKPRSDRVPGGADG